MKKIKITCKGTTEVSLDEINLIQGDLKSLNDNNFNKLKKQIFEHGFFVPFFITQLNEKKYLIDGHQRYRVINELIDKKEIIAPSKFPAVLIESKNINDAKKKLLAITSQYGKISKDSFAYFSNDLHDINFKECYSFDAFNIDSIFSEDENKDSNEIDVDSLDESNNIADEKKIKCPYCDREFPING